jgi:tetratricopeptide (TPR) repeat protein
VTSILERHRESLDANPADEKAFQALEEHHFLAGEWDALIALYEQRLEAPDLEAVSPARAALLLREARVWEERKQDPDQATTCYERALRADPTTPAPLGDLRRIHVSRQRWDLALQIADAESAHPALSARERGAVFAEMGAIWYERFDDPDLALAQFDRALAEVPEQPVALFGRARALQSRHRDSEAAAAWERALPHLDGRERVSGLIAQAKILGGSLGEPERAIELLRKALTHDPQNPEAVETLAVQARVTGQWSLLADLEAHLFELAYEARHRAEIAFETGRLHLEHLNDPELARTWLTRAVDLDPENRSAYETLADVERQGGDDESLLRCLERVVELSGDAPPVWALLEVASLHSDHRDDLRALENLERAFALAPDDALVAEALAETLNRLGRDEEFTEVLERRAESATDDETRAGLLAELAVLFEDRLSDPNSARDALERAFDACPAAPGVAASLERLYRKSESWNALRAFLERACRDGPEEARVGFLCSTAELLDARFEDPAGAIVALNAALLIDPGASDAHLGLQRLAQTSGNAAVQRSALEREAQVTTDPSRLAVLVPKLVRILETEERPEAALEWLERWVAAAPDDTEALTECTRLLDQLGHEQELIDLLGRLDRLVEPSQQAAIRRRLGALHVSAGRRDAAIRAYQAVLEVDPSDVEALEILVVQLDIENRLEDLVHARRRLADLLPPPRNAHCLDALAHLLLDRLGDVAGAIEVLTRLTGVEGAPDDLDERLDTLLDRTGDYEDLAERLQARLESSEAGSPAAVAVALRLGRVLAEHLGRFSEAAHVFREARDGDPGSTAARQALEQALRSSGDTAGLAQFYADEAARADDPAVADRMGFERAVLIQDSPEGSADALDTFRRLSAETADPTLRSQASERLVLLLERSGSWAQLRDHLHAALGDVTGEELLALHERIGSLSRDQLGDPGGAATHFEAIVKIAPERPEAWSVLARLYEESQRSEDLARALEGELATRPDPERELTLCSRAGSVYAGPLDDPERARHHYNRAIQLDPTHSPAAEFLLPFWEREGRHAAVISLLELQLATAEESAGEDGEGDARESASRRASLRVRIAALRLEMLDDLDGALAALEPALGEVGPQAFVAEPLAGLYQQAGHRSDLLDLCRIAAQAATDANERADWFIRAGAALREEGADREAADSYRRALDERPGDLEAETALRELYRKLDQPGPLAMLLEAELARLAGSEQVPLRMEVAELLAQRLSRPAEALEHLRRLMAVEPGHAEALDRALALAEVLGDEDAILEMLDASLSCRQPPAARAGLLARKASLLAHVQNRPDEAVAAFREALSLDPDRPALRAELRAVLEAEGRWLDVLDCMYDEAHDADDTSRASVFERAAEIAWQSVSPDAALPWLERLRALQPDDVTVVERIARIHRDADRPSSLLRVLEDELGFARDSTRELELHLERAQILEEKLDSIPLAIAEFEAARRLQPEGAAILGHLDRLYAGLGRHRERANVLETILAASPAEQRLPLLCEISALYSGPLSDPAGATRHLLCAIAESPPQGPLRAELLRALGDLLHTTGPWDAWARCAEEELGHLDTDRAADRRSWLHRELAAVYERDLGRPHDALPHLRTVVSVPAPTGDADATERYEAAEAALLRLLEAEESWLEWEARLAARTERLPQDAESWLALARLREEKLRAPASAMAAYKWLVELVPDSQAGLRGLRSTATRVGDWVVVARALELELTQRSEAPAAERSALLRSLGRVRWQHLGSSLEASRAFTAALEADPRDLESMRALETLYEGMEDWPSALDLYEMEAAALENTETERRHEVWLRAADLARTRTSEPERALRAYASAAALGPLSLGGQRERAALHRQLGQLDAFVDVFRPLCDEAEASAGDHVELAAALASLDRLDDALARIERALEIDPHSATAWDLAAKLREARGDACGAVEALRRAVEGLSDAEAATRLLRAGELCEAGDPEQAVALLEAAAGRDAAHLEVQATLARVRLATGAFEEAEAAASRALDLTAAEGIDDVDLSIRLGLIGGRAAFARDRHAEALRFFTAALSAEPDNPEALAGHGETLAALDSLEGARPLLERRLARGDAYPERARHLAIVGRALEAAGQPEAAAERFEAALRDDPGLDAAHEHLVDLHKAAGRRDEGIAGLERWAEVASEPADRALRLVRAAEWELLDDDQGEAGEQHLREALRADPGCARAAEALAVHLLDSDRPDEALKVAAQAFHAVEDPKVRSHLALIRGRVLEGRGELRAAAAAFGTAAPLSAEAALSGGRLLRGLGEWRDAADTLRAFAASHSGADLSGLVNVLEELGRLLAGPLEDLEAGLELFQRAVSLDPSRLQTRSVLADLLVHRPGDWSEALVHHRALLDADPTHPVSLRAIVHIARGRENESAVADGLAIQRALGMASPRTWDEAPEAVSIRLAGTPALSDPLAEQVRRMAQAATTELAEALDGSSTSDVDTPEDADATTAFRSAALAAEGRLTAPALVPLSDGEVREVLSIVAALVLDPEQVRGDGQRVNALSSALGRRCRRRLRRILDSVSLADVAAIDFAAWRNDVRALAAALALDEIGGDLRTALVALICASSDRSPSDLPPNADLRPQVAGCPEAAALLRHTLLLWLDGV